MRQTSKINRLNEFFDVSEIDWFLATCRDKLLDTNDALDYLYSQTITNYVTGVNPYPDIDNTLLKYFNECGII